MIGDELRACHERTIERFATLVEQLPPDPLPVPEMTWNTLEVAAHVLSAMRGFQRCVTDAEPIWRTITNGPAENERLLAATPERDPIELATQIRLEAARLRGLLDAADTDIPAWGDVGYPPPVLAGVNLGDVLLHGFDISRAIGRDWPITSDDAMRYQTAIVAVLPAFVDREATRGFNAVYGLILRGGPSWSLTFDDGTLSIEPGRPPRADCRILASPMGMVLTTTRRLPQWRAALTGQVVVYGRKPWLARRFASSFVRI